MPLIDKDKTVEAVATYLFVNDAIRGPENARRVSDDARRKICQRNNRIHFHISR